MKTLVRLLFFFFPVVSFAQNADSIWIVNNYTKREQYITMRDGVRLFTSIYIPKDSSQKHPVLVNRTPYGAGKYGAAFNERLWNYHWREYCKEKYIMVFQDVRGRWMSEGQFVDVRPFNPNKKTSADIDEASDTYDTVDWLVKNLSANNGNVGVHGVSYPGFYSTMAAMSDHPAIKAVSPQAPVTDWFLGDDFHHNGAFMLLDAFSFYINFGRPHPRPVNVAVTDFKFPSADNYDFFLSLGALPNITKKYMGDSIAFWHDLMNHPNYDNWWKLRNARNFIGNIKPATLVVGGLFDAEDVYGSFKTYQAIEEKSPRSNNRLVMGPWIHGGWTRNDGSKLGNVQFGSNTSDWYQKNVEIPFFNSLLKNKGTDSKIAEATVFFTGENKWKQLNQWPPAGIQQKDIYLHGHGKLNWSKPASIAVNAKPADNDAFSEYISDPAKPVPYAETVHLKRTTEYMIDDQRFAARRPDVLTFETDVLNNDVTLAGPVIADLVVSTTGTDADFVVKLIDVFPADFKYSDTDKYVMGGYQMLVRGEVMRGKFRNSFEKPEPFVPKKITKVTYALPDVAHTFKAGHKLMIQIQSSWFPLVDRNPNKFVDIYHAKDEDFQKANIKVYHSDGVSSRIILPVVNGIL
jgi:uncharacterized protein